MNDINIMSISHLISYHEPSPSPYIITSNLTKPSKFQLHPGAPVCYCPSKTLLSTQASKGQFDSSEAGVDDES